jgi:hypothetical protein
MKRGRQKFQVESKIAEGLLRCRTFILLTELNIIFAFPHYFNTAVGTEIDFPVAPC